MPDDSRKCGEHVVTRVVCPGGRYFVEILQYGRLYLDQNVVGAGNRIGKSLYCGTFPKVSRTAAFIVCFF